MSTQQHVRYGTYLAEIKKICLERLGEKETARNTEQKETFYTWDGACKSYSEPKVHANLALSQKNRIQGLHHFSTTVTKRQSMQPDIDDKGSSDFNARSNSKGLVKRFDLFSMNSLFSGYEKFFPSLTFKLN